MRIYNEIFPAGQKVENLPTADVSLVLLWIWVTYYSADESEHLTS